MRKWEVSSTLTVYHNGQFWVGVVEHVERGGLSVARVVFGAEPSNEEIYAWVLGHWESLQLSEACVPVDSRSERMAGNPKRRAREVAKAMKARGTSTASQLALARDVSGSGRKGRHAPPGGFRMSRTSVSGGSSAARSAAGSIAGNDRRFLVSRNRTVPRISCRARYRGQAQASLWG